MSRPPGAPRLAATVVRTVTPDHYHGTDMAVYCRPTTPPSTPPPDPNGGPGAWSAGPDETWNTDPGACHPDLGLQHTRRFYPTVTRLFDDRLLITDGTGLCGSGA